MRIRILFLALMMHQCWTHPSFDLAVEPVPDTNLQKDNTDNDGESSKRIIGSSVVTSVSVVLNGDEPEFTDALGKKVPKPQVPHLQVASPINLLNPDRYEFYTFDDNGELIKRLMTMEEIQSIVANGDGEGPTIIHSAPIDDRDPEKNVQDIVKSVQSVLNREVESNKNVSDMQPILDTPDVSSSWSMILPAIFGNTGGDIFPQNKPQQVVMTPDSDVVEATTKASKGKPTGKPKPQKKKNGNRRKSTTKRVSTTTPQPDLNANAGVLVESTTRKIFINNEEIVQSTEIEEGFGKKTTVPAKSPSTHSVTKRPQGDKLKTKTKQPSTTSTIASEAEPVTGLATSTPSMELGQATLTPVSSSSSKPSPSVETVVKEKSPQKKRKKPTRKPSTTNASIEVSTEKHFSYTHRRKHTSPKPLVHLGPHQSEEDSQTNNAHFNHKHKVSTTLAPITSSTPVLSTGSTNPTTTEAYTSTISTSSTPPPTTTTSTTTTPSTTPIVTTSTTTNIPTTSTSTSTPTPTTTTKFTFATHHPKPTKTTTQMTPTHHPETSTGSYHHSSSKKPLHETPDHINHQHDDNLNIHEDFSPSFKTEKVPTLEELTEKQEDLNTKLSFDQILQSLKEETSTDNEMQASESKEVQMPAKLPPNGNSVLEDQTTINLQSLDENDENTVNPILTFESLSDTEKPIKVEDEEAPIVVITSRPQNHISKLTEETTIINKVDETTLQFDNGHEEPVTAKEENENVKKEGSAHVVKFEPLFAEIKDPIVTTFTTTTESNPTTINEYLSNNTEDETFETTTLGSMESIMQKIDDIISTSLQSNETVETNSGHMPPSIPQISALTMSDFKTQAATMASILEDQNIKQTTVSSESDDEIQSLLSDVINQMTQSQQPSIATSTVTNNVVKKGNPILSQEGTAHRLSNFAQINPAFQLSGIEFDKTAIHQEEESSDVATSAPVDDEKPQTDDNSTTIYPENEPNYILISQGNGDYPAFVENENTEKNSEETTTVHSDESNNEEDLRKDLSEEAITIQSDKEQNIEEEFEKNTLASDINVNEETTEISSETSEVLLTDRAPEESFESLELTTIMPISEMESHLLHGEDPYIKLGEINAKPTAQSLAQMILSHDAKAEEQSIDSKEPLKIEETSAESEKIKIHENPLVGIKNSDAQDLSTGTSVVDASLTSQVSDKDKLEELAKNKEDTPAPYVEISTNAPKAPVKNNEMASSTLATKLEEIHLISTTQPAPLLNDKPSPTLAPIYTSTTKKTPNTLKPVSYFNMQPSLIMNDQKFNTFQASQQRPVIRPASLSNLKMPLSSATRAPVKLDPSPPDSKGLEASTAGLNEDLQQFSQLCNELAFSYWRSITSEKISSARSLVISPFALTSMLSMVFLGARGSTSGEMNEVLKLDDMVTFNPHLVFKNITDSVERATDSEISSSAFVREAFSDRGNGKILQFFKEKTQQFYSGHVEEVNFHVVNDIIRRRTNLLVKRHTMGKVMEYLRTNSVWVNGPLATISANLYQTDCSRASIADRDGEMFFQVHPSIRQRRLVPIPAVLFRSGFSAGYEPNLDATIVAFGRTFETVSTIYVMPGQQGPIAPADSLDVLEKKLIETAFTKHAWTDLLTSLMERQGLEVQLPRFSHRSFINASMGLQKMGLKGLFNSELADLRGLTGLAAKDIYLSDMIQINTFSTCAEDKIGEHHHVEMYPAPPIRKRNKDVRENEDPESDSSESIIDFGSIVQDNGMGRAFYDDLLDPKFLELPLPLRPRQARIPDAPRLRFDRPFLYFVRHNPTGMILFMGRFNPRLLP